MENVEGKLKTLATVNLVCAWLLAIGCLIYGFTRGHIMILIGVLVGGLWLLIGYVTSWGIYAFGEILESVKETNRTLKTALKQDVLAEQSREAEEQREKEEQAAEQARRQAEEAEKARQAQEEAERARLARIDAYWAAHAEEKAALEAKKTEAERALAGGGLTAGQKSKLEELVRAIDAELTKDRG